MSDKTHARWPKLPDNLEQRIVDNSMTTYQRMRQPDYTPDLVPQVFTKLFPGERPKRSKYGNKIVQCDGHLFDSVKEKDYYLELQLRKKAGEIYEFFLQPKYYYYALYCREENGNFFKKRYFYQADFDVVYPDGTKEVIDVKGNWKGGQTREFKRKKMIIEKLYHVKIKIV